MTEEDTENDENSSSNDGKPQVDIEAVNRGRGVRISVSGSNGETVDEVEESAKRLFDHAVDRTKELSEEPPTEGVR